MRGFIFIIHVHHRSRGLINPPLFPDVKMAGVLYSFLIFFNCFPLLESCSFFPHLIGREGKRVIVTVEATILEKIKNDVFEVIF